MALDFRRLVNLLEAHYREVDASQRLDQSARVALTVQGWIDATPDAGHDLDLGLVLAYLVPVRERVLATATSRAAVDAYCVEHGWTESRTRLVFQGLAALPDQPKTPLEQLVADAETLSRLGILGFARALAAGGASGAELEDIMWGMNKLAGRRLYTPQGQRDAVALKRRLQELVSELDRALRP